MATMSTKSRATVNELVSTTRAGEMLGVSDSRVRQLVGTHEKKVLKAVRLGKRSWMIAVSELEKYAKANEITLNYGPFRG
jgi:hypothetical protein